jgi:hypothetical protein
MVCEWALKSLMSHVIEYLQSCYGLHKQESIASVALQCWYPVKGFASGRNIRLLLLLSSQEMRNEFKFPIVSCP